MKRGKVVLVLLVLILISLFVSACSTESFYSQVDENLYIAVYNPEKAQDGTTIFFDRFSTDYPRILEIDMEGNILWEHEISLEMQDYLNPGFDVELLDNGNLQLLAPGYGVFEIERGGEIVWEYYDNKISHDADRLDNGNILIAYGGHDTTEDFQVKEITPEGEMVWFWKAGEHFDYEPYAEISCDGFTHTNAVGRLDNGNTLVSLRNFNMVVEVDPEGNVVNEIGKGIVFSSHDPTIIEGTRQITVASQKPLDCYAENDYSAHIAAMELDIDTDEIIWQYNEGDWSDSRKQLVRDVNKLSNGNYLVSGSTRAIEVSPSGEIVWELVIDLTKEQVESRGFYKIERIES